MAISGENVVSVEKFDAKYAAPAQLLSTALM
jgi:hypothetical protein